MRVLGRRTARREAELAAAEAFRFARRIANEDVADLGHSLADLDLGSPEPGDGLDTTLVPRVGSTTEESLAPRVGSTTESAGHLQQALVYYERAKELLDRAATAEDVAAVDEPLREARYQRACAVAVRDGAPLPQRRADCFFNPQHGPAMADLTWAPPIGVEREIEVCNGCARQLDAGEAPDQRLIRVGDRYVPWWQAGTPDLETLARTAHVHGSHTPYTSAHLAEAHARAGLSGANGASGAYGPGSI